MSRLFRFELAFSGEPQGVGFLQGLDDVGLLGFIRDDLYSLFDTLPIYELDEPVSFWLTEDGLRQYEDAINRIADEVSENGWQLIGASIDDSMENVIYKDMFQAAFPLEYIKSKQIEYLNVNNVDEFILSAK